MHDVNKDMELSKYRFSLAEETYKNAKMCFDNGFYRDCINRSYYAVFYGVLSSHWIVSISNGTKMLWLISIKNSLQLANSLVKWAGVWQG